MYEELDPEVCVSIERRPDGRLRLTEVDSSSIESAKEAIDDLVRRERLHVVARSELRALTARHIAKVDWNSLLNPRKGADETSDWRKVASLQERHRSHGDGWAWWTRFTQANPARVCLDVLTMLNAIANEHPSLLAQHCMKVDWLKLLRESMADSSTCSIAEVRSRLHERIDELEDD